jgi:hypothetical protein
MPFLVWLYEKINRRPSPRGLHDNSLPVEIDLPGGRRFMALVDVPAGGKAVVPTLAEAPNP